MTDNTVSYFLVEYCNDPNLKLLMNCKELTKSIHNVKDLLHLQYYINEHTCPTNLFNNSVDEVILNDDNGFPVTDEHGVFKLIMVINQDLLKKSHKDINDAWGDDGTPIGLYYNTRIKELTSLVDALFDQSDTENIEICRLIGYLNYHINDINLILYLQTIVEKHERITLDVDQSKDAIILLTFKLLSGEKEVTISYVPNQGFQSHQWYITDLYDPVSDPHNFTGFSRSTMVTHSSQTIQDILKIWKEQFKRPFVPVLLQPVCWYDRHSFRSTDILDVDITTVYPKKISYLNLSKEVLNE